MSDSSDPQVVPRRTFLDVLLGVGIVGSLVSALFPVLRYLKPLPLAAGGGPTRLTDEEKGKLASQGYVITSSGSKRAIVFEDSEEKLRALDAKCTHEGCTVQYVPGESVVWCACHNGRFDLDGRVLSGPPPKPLPEYTARREDDGSVIVSMELA